MTANSISGTTHDANIENKCNTAAQLRNTCRRANHANGRDNLHSRRGTWTVWAPGALGRCENCEQLPLQTRRWIVWALGCRGRCEGPQFASHVRRSAGGVFRLVFHRFSITI